GPVFVALSAGAGFVLAVSGCGAEHGAGEILRGGERRVGGVDATGQAVGDFLEEPAVAGGILGGGEGTVAILIWGGSRESGAAKQIRLVRAGEHTAAMEDIADFDAATAEFIAGGGDVRDDQVQSLGGAGLGRSDIFTEDDRAAGAWGRELNDAEFVAGGEVGV